MEHRADPDEMDRRHGHGCVSLCAVRLYLSPERGLRRLSLLSGDRDPVRLRHVPHRNLPLYAHHRRCFRHGGDSCVLFGFSGDPFRGEGALSDRPALSDRRIQRSGSMCMRIQMTVPR